MTRDFPLPAGAPMLTAQVNVDIELDCDYAYLLVNGTPVATNLSAPGGEPVLAHPDLVPREPIRFRVVRNPLQRCRVPEGRQAGIRHVRIREIEYP